MQKILYIIVPLFFLAFYLFFKWIPFKGQPYVESQYVLDTLTTIKVYDQNKNTPNDVRTAFKILRGTEKVINFYDSKSELSLMNKEIAIYGKAIPGSKLFKIIDASLEIFRLTSGNFDPCLGNLSTIWAFDRGGRLPSKKEISHALSMSGAKYVEIENKMIKASRPLKFDLGGIGKGWAVDLAAQHLRKKGYKKFLINTVSSTLVYNKKDNESLKIGIENPRGKGIVAVIYAKDGETISTSADNQRFFIKNGKRYHHILDPKTGYPSNNFISVTVIAKKPAYWTDAVSTAVFVMKEEEAVNFARENKIKLFAITQDGRFVIIPQDSWIKILTE